MKNSRYVLTLLLLVALAWMQGCDFINPEENPPGYIQVDSFVFDPTPTLPEFGPSKSTNIKDVWVYIDDEFQGAYELPAKFPVLKTGPTRVILSPGIFLNGISSTRTPYPFYRGHIQNIDIPALGTVKIDPVTSYFDSVHCSFCEDFEGSGFSLTSTSASDTVMNQTVAGDLNNHEGLCGVVKLDNNGTRFEITSTTSYDLPGSGAAVYLEFDYKINQTMIAGLFVVTAGLTDKQITLITLYPTETWKKIYIQLGYTVSAYPDADGYKIFFGGNKSPSVSQSEIYLDNIKVAHF